MYTIQKSPERKLKLCCLPSCVGKRYDLVHKFPMNNERAQQWIDIIELPELRKMPLDKVRMRYFICSKHFRPQDYKNCESRSLNTTAYPRLFLKTNEDEPPEQCTLNSNDGILNAEESEIATIETTIEIPDTLYLKEESTHPVTTVEEPIQYVLYSQKRPLILNKNRIAGTNVVIQKPIQIQTKQEVISPTRHSAEIPTVSYKNTRIIRNKVQSGIGTSNMILKRSGNHTAEPLRKKLALDQPKIIDIEFDAPDFKEYEGLHFFSIDFRTPSSTTM